MFHVYVEGQAVWHLLGRFRTLDEAKEFMLGEMVDDGTVFGEVQRYKITSEVEVFGSWQV